jgi:hypothetical protein
VSSDDASFPEFRSGRFAVLFAEIRDHVTAVNDPTVEASKRLFDLVDAIPRIAKKHGGKALFRSFGEMVYLWPAPDGVVSKGVASVLKELVVAIRRVMADGPSSPVYLVATEGDFFYQTDADGAFMNILGPGSKRIGTLYQMARVASVVALVDRAIADATTDLEWTARPDGTLALE